MPVLRCSFPEILVQEHTSRQHLFASNVQQSADTKTINQWIHKSMHQSINRSMNQNPSTYALCNRGVQSPDENVGYRFYRTKPNRLQNSKTENSVMQFSFQKTDFGGLGTVFHIVSFTIHLPIWYDQQLNCFSSCPISALLVLNHFGWQTIIVGNGTWNWNKQNSKLQSTR